VRLLFEGCETWPYTCSYALSDARHKPEGMADSGKAAGGGGSGSQNLSSSLKMSVEEAQLILNVKKGDSMEKIMEVSVTL
jgi:hypothetical protein